MVLTATAVTVMVSLAAPAAMAQEVVVRDHRDGSGEAQPIVRDHRDGSEQADPIVRGHRDGSEETGPIIRDHRDDSSSTVEEEEPYKNPGIRQCDITPPYCDDAEDQEEEPYKDPGIRQCDITPPYCEDIDEQEEPEGETDASATAQAGQTSDSGTVYGCAFDDYVYDEEFDTCVPTSESFGFFPVLSGEKPWPDSAGGYVGLLGDFVSDLSIGAGAGFLQIGLGHYVGDTLVEFGEGGGPIGWAIQGLGYTIGFTGDAAGVLVEGLGQVVGGAADVVGEVVDGIGNAAEDAWDEVTSWF